MTKHEVLMGGGWWFWRALKVGARASTCRLDCALHWMLRRIRPHANDPHHLVCSALGDAGKLMILWVFPQSGTDQKNSARNFGKKQHKDIETIRIPTYAQSDFLGRLPKSVKSQYKVGCEHKHEKQNTHVNPQCLANLQNLFQFFTKVAIMSFFLLPWSPWEPQKYRKGSFGCQNGSTKHPAR